MNCKGAYKKLNKYLSDALSANEAKKIESHLSSCLKCSEELEYLKKIEQTLTNIGHETVPDGIWEAVRKEIAGKRKPSLVSTVTGWLTVSGLYLIPGRKRIATVFTAAAFIILLALGFFLRNSSLPGNTSDGDEYMREYMATSMYDPLSDKIALNFILAEEGEF